MITSFGMNNNKLVPLGDSLERIQEAIWIDLFQPTHEEESEVERRVGLDVPTREEMQEIELSSRLYEEGGAAFMTASILSHTDSDDVVISPITFIVHGNKLITVRYEDPRTFGAFTARGQRVGIACPSAGGIAVGLLEASVERLADVLERTAHELELLSKEIFRPGDSASVKADAKQAPKRKTSVRATDFQRVLVGVGRKGDLVSNVRDSLITIRRLCTFFLTAMTDKKASKDVIARVKTLARDVESLSDHATFQSQKVNFLLDATLGMLNIEQNAIIKIFSVAAVVFLPPTLLASIYGMNFKFMPELDWPVGYPFAIGLMILSAILPYLFFKRRGWL
ncbi:MAG TPA: magnesium/cobalt transporter CorA [Hyphomonadaceae bacterium]|nr:magnesium/cobalt transporter CorA [Hyphomonadaceae bacterium]